MVDYFKYLGCTIWADGHESEEITERVKAAAATFGMLRQICTLKRIDRAVRVGIWKCFVMSVLLTGSGTWCPTATEIEMLEKTSPQASQDHHGPADAQVRRGMGHGQPRTGTRTGGTPKIYANTEGETPARQEDHHVLSA